MRIMFKKLRISLIFINLVFFESLSLNHHMHNLYTKFVRILEICKQFSHNLVNEQGNIARLGSVPKFSDLEVVALSLAAESESIDSENWLFEYKLQEYKGKIPDLLSRRQFNDRRKKNAGLCEAIRKRIALKMDGGEDFFLVDSKPIEVCRPARGKRCKMGQTGDFSRAPDFGYCVTGYHPIKWVIDDTGYDSNTSPCPTSIPIIRYAEILLTYAEAKCELGEFDETIWNETIKPLRERAGVDGTMPAAADPYMIDYFLNTITDNALLEIRRERGIELLLENVRWDDDMRWAMGELVERPWYGVYVGELGKVYDMNGDGTGDVCFVREEPERPQSGVTYRVLGSDFSLTDGDSGYLNCYIQMTRKWDDKKYVRPVPTTAFVLKNIRRSSSAANFFPKGSALAISAIRAFLKRTGFFTP